MHTPISDRATARNWPRLLATLGYFIAFIVLGLATALLGPSLPALMDQSGATVAVISYLFVARSSGYLVGSLGGGRLYDRLPGHRLMGILLLVMAGGLALVPSTGLVLVMFAAVLLVGVAEGGVDVGGNTLLVWQYDQQVGPYMNGLHFFFGLGATLSPLFFGWVLASRFRFAWTYWSLALVIVPLALLLLFLPSPEGTRQQTDGRKAPLNRPLVALIAALFILYVGAENSFGNWVATYAGTQFGADPAQATAIGPATDPIWIAASYLTSAFWGALTVGRLLAIPIAAVVRPRFILLADLLGASFSVALILVFPDSWTALWVGAIGAGLFMASVFPTTITFAGRNLVLTGQVTGLFFVGASLGGMSVPWLIGQLFGPFGASVTMLLILVALVLGLGVLSLLMARVRASGAQEL